MSTLVIKNAIIVDEGDAYNKFLFDKSIKNIKSRRIFKSVKSNINQSLNEKQNKIIDIYVISINGSILMIC